MSLEKLSAFGAKSPLIFSEKQFWQSNRQIILSKAVRTTSHIKTGNLLNIGSKFHFLEVNPLPYCPTRRREQEQTTVKMEKRGKKVHFLQHPSPVTGYDLHQRPKTCKSSQSLSCTTVMTQAQASQSWDKQSTWRVSSSLTWEEEETNIVKVKEQT